MTIINLPDNEAELFLAFREHQDTFATLWNAEVFKVKGGSVELHFDPAGNLRTLDFHLTRHLKPVVHSEALTVATATIKI